MQLHFWLAIALAVLLTLLFETDVVACGGLHSSVGDVVEFVVVTAVQLLTIVLIPTLLKLLQFGFVKRYLHADTQLAERRLAMLTHMRMLTMSGLLLLNTLLYYMFLAVSLGYMALVVLLCMAFVYPSEKRFESELEK